jgi:hypothetical protein
VNALFDIHDLMPALLSLCLLGFVAHYVVARFVIQAPVSYRLESVQVVARQGPLPAPVPALSPQLQLVRSIKRKESPNLADAPDCRSLLVLIQQTIQGGQPCPRTNHSLKKHLPVR